PAPVVGVLGADPLQVGGALVELSGQLDQLLLRRIGDGLLGAVAGLHPYLRLIGSTAITGTTAGGAARRGPGGRIHVRRGPHLTGPRIDPPPVPHHDALLLLVPVVGMALGHFLSPSPGSSTISASTTSSAPAPAPASAPAPAPAAPSAPPSAACC